MHIVLSIHDRAPVFLSPETAPLWLSGKPFAQIANKVLQTSIVECKQLYMYEVSKDVNSVRNETPDCLLTKKESEEKKKAKGISRFFTKGVKTEIKPTVLLLPSSNSIKQEHVAKKEDVAIAKPIKKEPVITTQTVKKEIPAVGEKRKSAPVKKGPLDNYFKKIKK